MFGKLLFFFVFPKLGISYKVKKYSLPKTGLYLYIFNSILLPGAVQNNIPHSAHTGC